MDIRRGFSLIELLVVFVIIGLVMAVVAPAVNKIWIQQNSLQEVRELKAYVRKISTRAFSQQKVMSIEFAGPYMKVFLISNEPQRLQDEDEQQQRFTEVSLVEERNVMFEHQFDYLRFPQSSVTAYASGYLSDTVVASSRTGSDVTTEINLAGLIRD